MELDDLVANAIKVTVEFDNKLEDPEFVRRMEIERKEMECANLRALIKNEAQ